MSNTLIDSLVWQTKYGNFSLPVTFHFKDYSVQGEMISREEYFLALKKHVEDSIRESWRERKVENNAPLEEVLISISEATFSEVNDEQSRAHYFYLKNVTYYGQSEPVKSDFWRGEIDGALSFSFNSPSKQS